MSASVFFLSLVLPGAGGAAPAPVTSSSALIEENKKTYVSEYGFRIDFSKSEWTQLQRPKEHSFITTMFTTKKRKQKVQPSLTVRVDRITKKDSLKKYVRSWIGEYPKFGFDVLGSQLFKHRGGKGFVVDLVNRELKRQVRQVVFLKDATAVTLTCRDHHQRFRKTLQSCNEIIRGFEWSSEY